ncbi:MAG: hypothetical protein KDC93_13565 [Cyclobacteriaceae bacterium]|nr:hypothetical protein [Cyclobacteriaceae bacterium]
MTISKPLANTLFSFGLFLVISFALVGMSLIEIISDQQPAWYSYLILVVLTPLSLFLAYRIFINYKVIELGNEKITIKYPVKNTRKHYPLGRVAYWRESIVKTGKNSTFKELEIVFDDNFKLNLGLREYSNYPKVQSYLTKKLAKKKQAD